MAEYVSVGKSDEVQEGTANAYEVGGDEVAVARSGGVLYAFGDICTHRGCNLSTEGEISGTEIQCGCHGSVFSMATGEALEGPATEPVRTYGVREQDGQIQIEA
jgi:3-phenylpropionate/trans-cinnamate dioxygenase ferredoxin component